MFPLITLGMTCYNALETVEKALRSLLDQDWPNTEIIIVDDCSIDGSVNIIKQIVSEHNNINFIQHSTNMGVASARNAIIYASNGDYIVFFDDDDTSMFNRVTVQYNKLQEYIKNSGQEDVVCFASGERVYPNGYRKKLKAIGSENRAPLGTEVVNYLLLNQRVSGVYYGAGTPCCAMMASKQLLKSIGGFDVKLRRVEDVDISIRLALYGCSFIGCEEELFVQQATIGNDKGPLNNFTSELEIVEKNKEYLQKIGFYHYAKEWFRFRFLYFSGNYSNAFMCFFKIFILYPNKTLEHLLLSGPKRIKHDIMRKLLF